MMRILLAFAAATASLLAQSSTVQLKNISRPGSAEFQIGDRFQITITAPANQPISVRTTRDGRTDWGPVIGKTDGAGQWSITGQYQASDFGFWDEYWTVGGRLATPVMHFLVGAPCLKGGHAMITQISRNVMESCETAEGKRSFQTPNDGEPFHTPDGRTISPPSMLNMGNEESRRGSMQAQILEHSRPSWSPVTGDNAAAMIGEIIGDNALTDNETENVLAIVRIAFKKRHGKPANRVATLQLLRNLANATEQDSLKQQIGELIAELQGRTPSPVATKKI